MKIIRNDNVDNTINFIIDSLGNEVRLRQKQAEMLCDMLNIGLEHLCTYKVVSNNYEID